MEQTDMFIYLCALVCDIEINLYTVNPQLNYISQSFLGLVQACK